MKERAFIGLNVLDAWLTKEAMAMGATELMPLARIFGVSILWKGLLAAAIVVGLYYWSKERLLLPLCIAMIGICSWNLLVCFVAKGGLL